MSTAGPIVVKKFGGSSVADVGRIRAVAEHVARSHRAGEQVVVVVSAMGKTTDELVRLAQEAAEAPDQRELDMLLTAGERITMSLLAMAIRDLGVKATSLTGSQSGIITNDCQGSARIVEVRPYRVEDALRQGHVVIVAGFQGVSYRREVTTLGRGGSDTTAVALAAALGAAHAEIYTDIDGVYSADPRIDVSAQKLAAIDHDAMLELARAGARVLAPEAVAYAREHGIALFVRASDGRSGETLVRAHAPTPPTATWGGGVRPEAAVIDVRAPADLLQGFEHALAQAPRSIVAALRNARESGVSAESVTLTAWLARPAGDKDGAAHRAWLHSALQRLPDGATISQGTLVTVVLPAEASARQWRCFQDACAPIAPGRPTLRAAARLAALVPASAGESSLATLLRAVEAA